MTPEPSPPAFIQALMQAAAYPHPCGPIRLLETHISWVLLTGDYAYKIKKPLNLGFLDFSTLARRRQACADEIRLNRRFAPELYLSVVPIHGDAEGNDVRMGTDDESLDEAFEAAVRMRQFPQANQLDHLLEAGRLQTGDLQQLAERVAAFHRQAPPAPQGGGYGSPSQTYAQCLDNFGPPLGALNFAERRNTLQALLDWTKRQFETLGAQLQRRMEQGHIRELHGDLHLANLVRLAGVVMPFDCIEFSAELRYIDTTSDIAFLMMDLKHRGRDDLAYSFLNRYLECTGDYDGVALLDWYRVYRAMVRAKIAAIRHSEVSDAEAPQHAAEALAYIDLAASWMSAPRPRLILMNGVSGSGKSWLSEQLAARLSAVRLRSDIERKRLHGLAPLEKSAQDQKARLYGKTAGLRTYRALLQHAAALLRGGQNTLVDGAFLKVSQRAPFLQLAAELQVPVNIVRCAAPIDELKRRIQSRAQAGNDASEADLRVLQTQLLTLEPLTASEQSSAGVYDWIAVGSAEAQQRAVDECVALLRASAHPTAGG